MKNVLILCFVFSSLAHATDFAFPQSYDYSRWRFRHSCQEMAKNIKGQCESFQVPSKTVQDLTIDYGVFTKPGSKKLLIVVSGNHGPEAYSGAAAQELLMKDYMPVLEKAGIDVVLIHALNPYGYKFNRRTDEENVNLNRNFGLDSKIFETQNKKYERFRSILEPEESVGLFSNLNIRRKMIWELLWSGFNSKDFAEGMNAGQYHAPKGLTFGGQKFQPQVQFMNDLLRPLLANYQDVLFLDFHTGLGAKNTLHIMIGEQMTESALKSAEAIFAFDKNKDGIEFTKGNDKGFYPTHGDLIDFVSSLAPSQVNVMPLVLEFGTAGKALMDQMDSAVLLILENQARYHGCSEPERCKNIEADFIELFNPASLEWRKQMLSKTNQIFSAISSRF